jgi:ABC-2 type transport system ATP-binding protein
LKAQVAGETVTLRPAAGPTTVADLRQALAGEPFVQDARLEGEALRLYVRDGSRSLPAIFQIRDRLGVGLETISLSQPSLDACPQRTGRALRDAGHPTDEVMAS